MSTPTYVPLAAITLTNSQTTVSFSAIPPTYRDLVLIVKPISTSGVIESGLRFNGVSTSTYSRVLVSGTGAAATTSQITSGTYIGIKDGITSGDGVGVAQVMDYSATDKHKIVLVRKNEPDSVSAALGRFAATTAITAVSLTAITNQFALGSRFELYGIAS